MDDKGRCARRLGAFMWLVPPFRLDEWVVFLHFALDIFTIIQQDYPDAFEENTSFDLELEAQAAPYSTGGRARAWAARFFGETIVKVPEAYPSSPWRRTRSAGLGSWRRPPGARLFTQLSSCHCQGQEVDREVREPPAQGIFPSGLEPDAEDQQVQQRIAGFDRRLEQHRDLRTLRKFFQTAMSWLQCLLGNRINLLQLWKKYEILAETNRVGTEQLRRHLNPWLCYQEEQQSWSQERTFWTTKNVLPGETDAEKGHVRKSTDATQRYFRDGTPVNRIETRCMSSGGEKNA